MTRSTSQILDDMLNADPALYRHCLDSPGFAKNFNDLAQRAICFGQLLIHCKACCEALRSCQHSGPGTMLAESVANACEPIIRIADSLK